MESSEIIHEESAEGIPNYLQFFDIQRTNVTVERTYLQQFNPTETFNATDSNIKFRINGLSDSFIDMKSITLHYQFRVLKENGDALKDNNYVLPQANIFHTMFSQVSCKLNNSVLISRQNDMYNYQAYIQNALYTSQQHKDSALTNQGYFGDKPEYFQDVLADETSIRKSPNAFERLELIADSKWCDMSGPINVSFFDTENLLLNNISIDLEFVRAKPEFILYDEKDDVKYKIEIRNPTLTVRRYKPSAPFLSSVNRNIEKRKATYAYRNVDMKATNIGKNLTRFVIPNSTGQIPSRIIFMLVEAAGFSGAYKKNPYYARHFGLENLNLYVNSQKYPSIPITYNFDADLIAQGYDFFLEQLGKYKSRTNGITKHGFQQGYTLFVFDLTSDLSASEEHFSMLQTGDIYAEFNFKAPLTQEITCVTYCEFEKLIEIDEYRNIRLDDQLV
jgi:hypothetical protein